jgi:hypothetical protein
VKNKKSSKVITKRKAMKIIKNWMYSYGAWLCGELEYPRFEDECDEIFKWFRGIKG